MQIADSYDSLPLITQPTPSPTTAQPTNAPTTAQPTDAPSTTQPTPPPSGAGGLECPNSFDVSAWKEMELNTDAGVRFKYAIVLSESGSPEESIFCGRLESDEASQGWVAWGISPAGMCVILFLFVYGSIFFVTYLYHVPYSDV